MFMFFIIVFHRLFFLICFQIVCGLRQVFSNGMYTTDARPVATQGLMSIPSGLTPPVCGVVASAVANALTTAAAPLFKGAGAWQVFPMLFEKI